MGRLTQLRAHWTCVLENAGTFTYTAESQLVTMDRCTVEGWLDIQRDALSNSWLHAWFELRPYETMLMQPFSDCTLPTGKSRCDIEYLSVWRTRISCHGGRPTKTRARPVHEQHGVPAERPERGECHAVEVCAPTHPEPRCLCRWTTPDPLGRCTLIYAAHPCSSTEPTVRLRPRCPSGRC